ncbi:2735_t:CDS:2 [Funneliformis caledonium]|uniref:2735_t:CDS:1 n=1 Tax=Funneliformis caledonium TaxID=1117310 RepID=A0A9N9CR71_9GLOM|nr:2735_t:CDS:2 [Funneliformis caledonium]
MPSNVKTSFQIAKDELLRCLVNQYRTLHINHQISWVIIAKEMQTRTSKQCRERWLNHLDDSIDKSPLTENEEKCIRQTRQHQPNLTYVQIAKMLPGRTPLIVKNFIYRERFKTKSSTLRIQRKMSINFIR